MRLTQGLFKQATLLKSFDRLFVCFIFQSLYTSWDVSALFTSLRLISAGVAVDWWRRRVGFFLNQKLKVSVLGATIALTAGLLTFMRASTRTWLVLGSLQILQVHRQETK